MICRLFLLVLESVVPERYRSSFQLECLNVTLNVTLCMMFRFLPAGPGRGGGGNSLRRASGSALRRVHVVTKEQGKNSVYTQATQAALDRIEQNRFAILDVHSSACYSCMYTQNRPQILFSESMIRCFIASPAIPELFLTSQETF
jgi:hypothetical protein